MDSFANRGQGRPRAGADGNGIGDWGSVGAGVLGDGEGGQAGWNAECGVVNGACR